MITIDDLEGEPTLWEVEPGGGNVLLQRCDLYNASIAHWHGDIEAKRRRDIVWDLITKAVGDPS